MLLLVFQRFSLFFFAFFLVFSLVSSYICSMVVSSFSHFFASASAVGFCGSRSCVPALSLLAPVTLSVPLSVPVLVGCASGFDCFVRGAFPCASVFRVSSFGSGRGAFARRSSAMVGALASYSGAVLVGAPACACPVGLVPSSSASVCFRGLGSGSWASLALARGLGVSLLVFLPEGVCPPVLWGFSSVGGGWWWLSAS